MLIWCIVDRWHNAYIIWTNSNEGDNYRSKWWKGPLKWDPDRVEPVKMQDDTVGVQKFMFWTVIQTLGCWILACIHFLRTIIVSYYWFAVYLDMGFETLESIVCELKVWELTVLRRTCVFVSLRRCREAQPRPQRSEPTVIRAAPQRTAPRAAHAASRALASHAARMMGRHVVPTASHTVYVHACMHAYMYRCRMRASYIYYNIPHITRHVSHTTYCT